MFASIYNCANWIWYPGSDYGRVVSIDACRYIWNQFLEGKRNLALFPHGFIHHVVKESSHQKVVMFLECYGIESTDIICVGAYCLSEQFLWISWHKLFRLLSYSSREHQYNVTSYRELVSKAFSVVYHCIDSLTRYIKGAVRIFILLFLIWLMIYENI